MALVVDGGGLVNKGGSLGTGAACCCATGATGACCVCPEMPYVVGLSWAEFGEPTDDVDSLYPDLQPITDANLAWAQEWADAALALGYECVRTENAGLRFFPDPFDNSQGFWYSGLSSGYSRCCGIVDYEAEPTIIVFPDDFPEYFAPMQVSIYPCIQDEVTRICYDDLNKAACDEMCGVYHPNETCAEEACNPLP